MPVLLQQALGALLRHVLQLLAGYLVAHGVWHQDEATTYIAAATAFLLALSWSLWSKYKGRLRFLIALEMPAGTSEAKVKQVAKTAKPLKKVKP